MNEFIYIWKTKSMREEDLIYWQKNNPKCIIESVQLVQQERTLANWVFVVYTEMEEIP